MTFRVSSSVGGITKRESSPPVMALVWTSRRTRCHLPRLRCTATVSSRKIRVRRKWKRRRQRRRSAPEVSEQVTVKGNFRAKGKRSKRKSFEWLWPPPARSISLASATMWNAILRFAPAGELSAPAALVAHWLVLVAAACNLQLARAS